MNTELLIPLLAAAVVSGTPILYATLGEIITEKSGVLNLGVEGAMMVGCFCAFLTAKMTGNPWLAFVAAGLAGMLTASLHGVVCLIFQGNQVVSGLALTIFGVGLANYLGTPSIGLSAPGFAPVPIPGLAEIPLLGPVLFNHDPLVYLSYLAPFAVGLFFRYSRFGLGMRSVGEFPAGVSSEVLIVW